VLESALRSIESSGGLASATPAQIADAVAQASGAVAEVWTSMRATPPRIVWKRTLEEARELSRRALEYRVDAIPGAHSYCEVPFGGAAPKSDVPLPWDASASVEIPGAGFRISGYVDRLDLSSDRNRALVRDYKTGKTPKKAIVLDGGKELQRCLYAYAAKALIGGDLKVSASLFYPRDLADLRLEAPDATMVELADYLRLARDNLSAGLAIVGPDTGGKYDDLAFALPANPGAVYLRRKAPIATERLGAASEVWEVA
jgi:hypothetical protein